MRLTLTIDGSTVEIDASLQMMLAEAVQKHHGVPTPCGSAHCGACTVLLNDAPVLSCITPAALCEGARLTTAAKLADDTRLASLRNLFADPIIRPCGMCASGFIASAAALLDANPRPTRDDARHALAGHACLCIGYGTILDAVLAETTTLSGSLLSITQPEALPSRKEITEALAQERQIACAKTVDPLAHLRSQFPAVVRHSIATPSQRQLCGSWIALQGTDKNGAAVFVELEVDAETQVVSLRRVATLLIGVHENPAAIAESGVMRGIFLSLRPAADAAGHSFPQGFPTSIDLPEISSIIRTHNASTADAREVRRDVSFATVRAIAGAIFQATGTFPQSAPFAPDWSEPPDLDNASNIS